MQFGYADTDYIKAFHASTTSTRFLIRGDGNIVSGWNVDAVVVDPYVVTEVGPPSLVSPHRPLLSPPPPRLALTRP